MTLIPAWNNDPALKERVIASVLEHRKADAIIQGQYIVATGQNDYKGCALGCALAPTMSPAEKWGVLNEDVDEDDFDFQSFDWHQEAEKRLGMAESVSYVYEAIFEQLPNDGTHAAFACDALEVLPPGTDTSLVTPHFMVDLLSDAEHGVVNYANCRADAEAAIKGVAALYQRRLNGDEPARREWLVASEAARAVVGTVGNAAYYAATATALATANAVSATGLGTDHYQWMAKRLIHHLATAPMMAVQS